MNHGLIPTSALVAMQNDALHQYPKRSFGYVQNGAYVSESGNSFDDRPQYWIHSVNPPIEAIVYSRPDGNVYPDQADMELQLSWNVPVGIIATDGKEVAAPVFWGDALPIAPLVGRSFMHGVWDCYSLVRDAYRLGSVALAAQGIEKWPLPPVTLPEVPRSDCWWDSGQDLYLDHLKPAGFVEIKASEARAGDGFLLKIRSETLNHAGVLVDFNSILHHLPTRLSRREASGMWARSVSMWVRYRG